MGDVGLVLSELANLRQVLVEGITSLRAEVAELRESDNDLLARVAALEVNGVPAKGGINAGQGGASTSASATPNQGSSAAADEDIETAARIQARAMFDEADERTRVKQSEPQLLCVQCQKTYFESSNVFGSCHVHTQSAIRLNRGYKWPCCDRDFASTSDVIDGCAVNKRHRAVHHEEYAYAAYGDSYWDTIRLGDKLFSHEARDLDDSEQVIATVGTIRESDELCVYAAVRIGQQLGNVRLRTWPISSLATWAHAGADDDAQDDGEAEAEAMLAAVASGHQPRAMHRRDTMRVSDRDGRFAEIVPVVDEATGALARLTVRWELISKVGVGQINIDLSFDDDGTATAAVDIVSEPLGEVVPDVIPQLPDDELDGAVDIVDEALGAAGGSGADKKKKKKKTRAPRCEGGSVLRIKAEHDVDTSQSLGSSSSNTFTQFVNCNLLVINPEEKPTSVTDVIFEYLDEDGDWVEADGVSIGTRTISRGWPDYAWSESGTNFNIEASTSLSVAVQGRITVEGKSGSDNFRRSRIHQNLPSPLRFRVTLEDIKGEEVMLPFEKANGPLGLPTLESVQASGGLETVYHSFVFVDDLVDLGRYWWGIYRKNGEFYFRTSSAHHTLSDNFFERLQFQARRGGFPATQRLPDWCSSSSTYSAEAHAMCEATTGYVYGFRLEVTSGDNRKVFYLERPSPPDGPLVVTVEPATVFPGQDLVVSWDLPEMSSNGRVGLARASTMPIYDSLDEVQTFPSGVGLTGSMNFKAPVKPGLYEARYHLSYDTGATAVCAFEVVNP